ncbi:Co-chaperone protein HscB homolog [Candidatus Terasakiella magnetica]|uniref:Co-chaperone protein HscB homolog n=1 Tax=Candidatus Terasakiella magnetica TaxID=1867952 RepID=A0A1C3RLB7_9PROT|nr:Fe-S protein assembly co-chaperone HscB [Candidatus Terasakiella magnetica]SCA58074.1 Co-chaperone protein HscB homolog [Candidatus Terasakiella magnetica]
MDTSTLNKTLRNDQSGLHPCWSCKGPAGESDLFCETCHAVQPPGHIDHFARLGLHKDYAIDVDALELTYFELQRHLHPDRFANKTAQEKSLSQQQAVSLNEAFETLKDPLLRADYLLQVSGVDGISHDHTVNDPILLMEAMETREALMEAEDVAIVNKLSDKARRDVRDCVKLIAAAFEATNLDEARKLALRLKYLTKLLEETRHHKARLVMK